MNKWHYFLVDVFTDRIFGGNPLAVFPDGQEIPEPLMQKIAKEFNLSETTFVLPPKTGQGEFWVRIFTPATELPMAGHPTLGTAFVLARENRIPIAGDSAQVTFEEGVGPVPVTVRFSDGQPSLISMEQPLPELGATLTDRAGVTAMLSLEEGDLVADLPCQAVSSGVPYLMVPVRSLAAVKRARLRLEVWEKLLGGFAAAHIYLFTRETERPGSAVHARMFAPAAGIPEDPATGSAGGPLAGYLIAHGVIQAAERVEFTCEQGFEMERESFIHVVAEGNGDRITKVTVSGECVPTGEGWFEIP